MRKDFWLLMVVENGQAVLASIVYDRPEYDVIEWVKNSYNVSVVTIAQIALRNNLGVEEQFEK